MSAVDADAGEALPKDDASRAWRDERRSLEVIMFTDIEGSVHLQEMIGTTRYVALLRRHDALFGQALDEVGSGTIVKHTGDGFLTVFPRTSDAVMMALRFQWLLANEGWPEDAVIAARIGIHEGEILMMTSSNDAPGMVGAAVNLAARVMSLAVGRQILVTRSVFDATRQCVSSVPRVPESEGVRLGWEAHGAYLVRGIDSPVDVYEIGVRGHAPFCKPAGGADSQRSVSAEEELTLGWRPAKAMEVPRRSGWMLERRLGEGGFGEVWLARNKSTREHRVFKFCFDSMRLRSFKRELALFRLIRERIGLRPDIASLYEVQLEAPPFFLESEFCAGGVLDDWLKARADAGAPVPLGGRLDVLARVARALGSAHSLGIIHKDVKPSNIFMEMDAEGRALPKLADFGIGVVVDRAVFEGLDIGFSEGLTITVDPSRTGTRMYSAPEYMIGKPPSVQGDIYSLGVLFYQMVIMDFQRPLGVGWQRDVDDLLLIEDIERCVDVEPERRFGSALDVAERIEALEQRRAARAREKEAEREREEHARVLHAHKNRMRFALTAAVVALFAASALTIILVQMNAARKTAEAHAQEIDAERRQVIAQTELGRERLYMADMVSVTQEVIKRRAEGARELLNHQRPLPGQRDLRQWEWYYAASMLDTGDIAATASDTPLRALALSPKDDAVAVGGDDGVVSIWSTDSFTRLRSWPGAVVEVRALAWLPDGSIAAGLANGEIVLLEPGTMREITRWSAHARPVRALHVSRADGTLISGGEDGALHWWRDGKSVRDCQWQGHVSAVDENDDGTQIAVVLAQPGRLLIGAPDEIQQAHESALQRPDSPLAWRPRSTELALAINDMPMAAWNPQEWSETFFVTKEQSPGSASFAWSADGLMAAVGGVDGKITLVNLTRVFEPRMPSYGHRGAVTGLRWMRGRTRLISIGHDGTLRAWDDLWRPAEVSGFNLGGQPDDIATHPQRDEVALMLSADDVRLVDGRSFQIKWSRPMPLPAPENATHRGGKLAFSPDGKWLAAACPGRGWVAWSLEDSRRFSEPGRSDVLSIEWTDDSSALVVRDKAGWRVAPLVADAAKPVVGGTGEIAWAGGTGGQKIGVVIKQQNGWHVQTYSTMTGSLQHDTPLQDGLGMPGCARAFLPGGLLAIGFDSGLLVWVDMTTGAIARPPLSHVGPLQSIAWHPDGKRVVSAGADGSARIFDVRHAAQIWSVETMLPSDIVSACWSADGTRLMVAAASANIARQFDSTRAMQSEGRLPMSDTPANPLKRSLAAVQSSPDEIFGWRSLADAIEEARATDAVPEDDLIAAAARLGRLGLRAPTSKFSGTTAVIVREWRGHALPMVMQTAQAAVLEQWMEVAALTQSLDEKNPEQPWLLLHRIEALKRLGRHAEAENAGRVAWQAHQRLLGIPSSPPSPTISTELPRAVNLKPWATIRKKDDWTGSKGNNLGVFPDELPQEGFAFQSGDFIQLAGNGLRMSMSRMLPRATGWIPLGGPARRVAFLVGACAIRENIPLQDQVIGSLCLQRESGGVVIVPLIYGRNIWDCWYRLNGPQRGLTDPPPADKIAWRGKSPYTESRSHELAFYRLEWEASGSAESVTSFSIISHMRAPAPMVMAAEVLPPMSAQP